MSRFDIKRRLTGGSEANSISKWFGAGFVALDFIRALFAGGYTTTYTNKIEYVTIATEGNAIAFGDLTVSRSYLAGLGSATRGVFAGGNNGTAQNVIDYVTN